MSDPSSYSNFDLFRCKHLKINWFVDFETTSLKGHVEYDMEVIGEVVLLLNLDSYKLNIKKIFINDYRVNFEFGEFSETFGSKLMIELPYVMKKNEKFVLKVEYETSKDAMALQWMTKKQTIGKKHPYMYSQCQAILARTILPCQDSPSAKFTYEAEVSVASPLVVLMSAVQVEEKRKGNILTYCFQQTVPIPSYLIAIVAGALVSRKIGPRSKVWCEKEMVDEAAEEFAETEKMLETAEKLVGPYVWKQYDLLILPPSFPYGGMENPCLTFLTAALVAGDKSLTHVVAHEISHSWTGNLVTNKTWVDFWLNEGFTRFLERKIISKLYGEPTRQFQALAGLKDLKDSIETLGAENPLTNLVPDLNGVDPEDAFSRVPYEKGFTLLYYLEQLLGGPDVFEPFLRSYIETFKYKSVTTDEWKDFLFQYFNDQRATLDTVDWDSWLYSPGMPHIIPDYDQSMMKSCQELADRWSKTSDGAEFDSSDVATMSSKQKAEFLGEMLQREPLSEDLYMKMETLYNFSDSPNCEIQLRWIQMGLASKVSHAIQPALDYVTKYGREKYVCPIFRSLGAWSKSRDVTVDKFYEIRESMHPITASRVFKDLQL